MAENHRLIRSTSSNKAQYGSVAYDRLADGPYTDRVPEVRFVYRKRDCKVVTILGVLVLVAVITTLLIGLPNIRRKADNLVLLTTQTGPLTSSGPPPSPVPVTKAPVSPVPEEKSNVSTLYPDTSSKGIYTEAAVTTNCVQCSNIAADILRKNGSAVDAAIAATFCLSVVDLHHTGLGGGFVMTIYDRKERFSEVIDARETAPQLSNETMFSSKRSSSIGGLSVAVPGQVRGLWEAHKRHGHLNWSTLIEPSIELCENGFQVGLSLDTALDQLKEAILKEPTLRVLLVNSSTNTVFERGDWIRQPVLARTLQILAKDGGDALYDGQLATDLVNDIQSLGGIISLDDLKNYRALVKDPVAVDYKSVRGKLDKFLLYSTPPPSSGGLVAFFLNILEGYNVTSLDTLRDVHLVVEALKFTYARRTQLSDPDYEDLTELMSNLTSKKYSAEIRALIHENQTFPADYYGGVAYQPPDAGTSHVSIVAPNGDSVAVTSTINQKFGALFVSESTGIILNDEMDDFSSPNIVNFFGVPPSEFNYIVPGKRPVSSMCPTIITDANGDVVLATGAAGGTMITSSTALVILRHLWFGQDLKVATDAIRLHDQLYPNQLIMESGLSKVVIDELSRIGHNVVVISSTPTAVNSISRLSDTDPLVVIADRRVDGGQSGF